MDLLQSILRCCDAEKYTEVFRNNNIDVSTLKLLERSDYRVLGVEDEVAVKLISHCSTLQIPSEKLLPHDVNMEYTKSLLQEISRVIPLHTANLFCAASRKDVVNCNLSLIGPTQCLIESIDNLQEEINSIKTKAKIKRKRTLNKRTRILLVISALIIPITVYIHRKFIK